MSGIEKPPFLFLWETGRGRGRGVGGKERVTEWYLKKNERPDKKKIIKEKITGRKTKNQNPPDHSMRKMF